MSEDVRAVPGGYGPRYGPFSQYAPEPQPTTYYSGHGRGGPDAGQGCEIPPGWDPYEVLRRYAQATTHDHVEEAS